MPGMGECLLTRPMIQTCRSVFYWLIHHTRHNNQTYTLFFLCLLLNIASITKQISKSSPISTPPPAAPAIMAMLIPPDSPSETSHKKSESAEVTLTSQAVMKSNCIPSKLKDGFDSTVLSRALVSSLHLTPSTLLKFDRYTTAVDGSWSWQLNKPSTLPAVKLQLHPSAMVDCTKLSIAAISPVFCNYKWYKTVIIKLTCLSIYPGACTIGKRLSFSRLTESQSQFPLVQHKILKLKDSDLPHHPLTTIQQQRACTTNSLLTYLQSFIKTIGRGWSINPPKAFLPFWNNPGMHMPNSQSTRCS